MDGASVFDVCLINSYLVFSFWFLLFSMTTLLQLGVYIYIYTRFKKRCFFKNIYHIYNYAFSVLVSFFVNTIKDTYVYRKKTCK